MNPRLFLSCSQDKKKTKEIDAVHKIKAQLESEFGFKVVVGIDENHWNGNPKLIDALKESDYFIFIDFERKVGKPQEQSYFSLYSHQELAIAMALGFDSTNMLIFHQKNMVKIGMLSYTFVNGEFEDYSDVADIVIENVRKEKWRSDYSRKLVTLPCELKKDVDDWRDSYSLPRVGNEPCLEQRRDLSRELRRERIATVPLQNRRKDIAAMNCVVHLKDIQGEHDFIDRAPIKAAGLNGFSHTIWPGETVKFDLFGYDVGKKSIFMHTECDITTPEGCRKPLISKAGTYFLIYEAYAEHFPVSTFQIKLSLGDEIEGGIKISLCSPDEISEPISCLTAHATRKTLIEDHNPCGTSMVYECF